MSKRLSNWSIPLAAFVCAAVVATFCSPALSAFTLRLMAGSTGTPPPPCDKCDNGSGGPSGGGNTNSGGCGATKQPVRYFTGEKLMTVKELSSTVAGGWNISRSYFTKFEYNDGAMLGLSWRLSGNMLKLAQVNGYIVIVGGSTAVRTFIDNGNGTYSAAYSSRDTLTYNSAANTFTFTDLAGSQWVFNGLFTNSPAAGIGGALLKYTDPAGNTHTVSYNTSGPAIYYPSMVLSIYTSGSNTIEEDWLFNYFPSGSLAGWLQGIVLRRKLNGVDQGIVRQTAYTHYASSGPNGPQTALQRAQVLDAASNVLETRYYRYYAATGNAYPLRYVLDATGYARALAALGSDAAIDSASDATLAPYAEYFFQWDGSNRVTLETVQGAGCGCGSTPGLGTYTFSYSNSSFSPDGPNTWKTKTVETLPDGNQNIVYCDGFGDTMLEVFKEVSTGRQWLTYHQFDSQGRQTLTADTVAMTAYSEAVPGLAVSGGFQSNAGLFTIYTYSSSTNLPAGQVAGFLTSTAITQGTLGARIPQSQILYTSHAGTSGTIYPVSSRTVYRNTDGTGAQTTSFTYSWQGSTNQILQKTTTSPVVPTNQNGSGIATKNDVVYDAFGREIWSRDEEGFLRYTEYDQLSGGVTKSIVDVSTALTSDFKSLPSGWTTPAGGGLHLKTLSTVDSLGRTTKLTDPAGSVTYTVYNDPAFQVRVYPGWNSATNLPTGPTQLRREDRPHSYRETLTMSAAPAVSGGVPTGTEAVSSLQSLSREYLDTADRVTNTDSYFNFTAGGFVYSTNANIGTLGTNFYRRLYNYDQRGRRNRDVDWTGTIRRTFYDSNSRVQSTWIGTNDTPASGTWSPTNNTAPSNMKQVTGNVYDGGGIGDGNLTSATIFDSSSGGLVTTNTYDFRNRLAQDKYQIGVTKVHTYDNLNQETQAQTYTSLVTAANLRVQRRTAFDEKGRVYQSIRFQVDTETDASPGTVRDSLTTNFWSNPRGIRVKSRGPNGDFRKVTFDGARRETASFVCFDDSEANTDYNSALTVNAGTGAVVADTVVEETVTTYDAASNVIETTTYSRCPSSTKTGDLATGWMASDSRRKFSAQWYDSSDRPIALADYGTNNGTALSRPSSPPPVPTGDAISYMLTLYGYDAGGRRNKVTDSKNRVTQTTFDGLGRITQTVENNVTGNPAETSLDTDRKTALVYDTAGRLSKRVAYNPKGSGLGVQQETTTYVYGTIANQATPASFRNDLLVAEIYPDSDDTYNPAGAAGAQLGNGTDGVYDRVEYTYDYASRPLTKKDQRGVVHTYLYDMSGRFGSDQVTTLPAGVDGTVQRVGPQYDSISRVRLLTSYSDSAGTTVFNQVAFTYDNFGNQIKRQDSHVGAIVAGTTPSTAVAYSDGGPGTSGGIGKYVRIASETYPNGRQLFFNYPLPGSTSVGDHLSRIDNIAQDSSSTTQFAQYSYMGAGRILDIAHPQVTNGLVYRQGPENAPGAWDQFDRQLFTKWRNSANTFSHDLWNYSYDSVSNRLTRQNAASTTPGTPNDEFYTYDGLRRLTKLNRGKLSGSPPTTPLTIADAASNYEQSWPALESQGNWRSFQVAPTGAGNFSFQQTRSHNAANEIDVDNSDANAPGASISNSWIAPTYDKAGNETTSPVPGAETTGYFLVYDAWNRLVKVQNGTRAAPGSEVVEYQYDAGGWRTVKLAPNGVNWNRTDYYYDLSWRCVEERKLTAVANKTTVASTPSFQWVWDLKYVDAVLFRDVVPIDTTKRLYYCQDANQNTTALVNQAGAVVERYVYDAYGKVTVLSATWTGQAVTANNNEILFAGYRKDPETQIYLARNRSYHPSLGRWMQRDAIGYKDGSNLYQYAQSQPYTFVDPSGLKCKVVKDYDHSHEVDLSETSGFWYKLMAHATVSVQDEGFSMKAWGIGMTNYILFWNDNDLEVEGLGVVSCKCKDPDSANSRCIITVESIDDSTFSHSGSNITLALQASFTYRDNETEADVNFTGSAAHGGSGSAGAGVGPYTVGLTIPGGAPSVTKSMGSAKWHCEKE